MAVFAVAMLAIIVIAAVAIDISEWYSKHHQAQVSADAAALAAANCLAKQACTSTATGGDAYTTATNYATTNGVPASTVTIAGGYVTVTTAAAAPVSFAGAFGVHPSVSARAVASYDQTTAPANLFAQDCTPASLSQPVTSASCTVTCTNPGITISTSGNTTFTGAIQTNGSLSINAHNNDTLGDMLYGDPVNPTSCGAQTQANYTPRGASTPYGPPQEEPAFATFPDTYNTAVATSNCTAPSTYFGSGSTSGGTTTGNSTTYTGSSSLSVPAGTTIVNNVIQGTLTINGSLGMTSTPVTMCALGINVPHPGSAVQLTSVTLSAASVTIARNGFGMTPNPNNTPDSGQTGPALAIYCSSTNASSGIDLSQPNNTNIVGAVYVPASNIVMGGNNGGLSFWEANTITFQGNNAAGGPTETLPGLGSDLLVQ